MPPNRIYETACDVRCNLSWGHSRYHSRVSQRPALQSASVSGDRISGQPLPSQLRRIPSRYRTTTDGKKTISLSVNFAARSDGDEQFVGRLERDFMYRGHPVHNLTGQFIGGNVTIQTGSVLAFGSKSDHAWTYHGCLIGRSIIGRYAGRDKKGKLKGGIFHLRTGK